MSLRKPEDRAKKQQSAHRRLKSHDWTRPDPRQRLRCRIALTESERFRVEVLRLNSTLNLLSLSEIPPFL